MNTIGAYEAKTHLPELLERVAKGERFVITKRGRQVAMLVPPEAPAQDVATAVRAMLEWRDANGPRLGGDLRLRDLIEHGRRF